MDYQHGNNNGGAQYEHLKLREEAKRQHFQYNMAAMTSTTMMDPPPQHIAMDPKSVVSGVTLDEAIHNEQDDDIPSKLYLPPQIDEEDDETLEDEAFDNAALPPEHGKTLSKRALENETDEDIARFRFLQHRLESLKAKQAEEEQNLNSIPSGRRTMQAYPTDSRQLNFVENDGENHTDDEGLMRGIEEGQELMRSFRHLAPGDEDDREIHTNNDEEEDMENKDEYQKEDGGRTSGHRGLAMSLGPHSSGNHLHVDDIEKEFEMVSVDDGPWKDRVEKLRYVLLAGCCFIAGIAVTSTVLALMSMMEVDVLGFEVQFRSSSALEEQAKITPVVPPSPTPTVAPTAPTFSPSSSTLSQPTPSTPLASTFPSFAPTPISEDAPTTPPPSFSPSTMPINQPTTGAPTVVGGGGIGDGDESTSWPTASPTSPQNLRGSTTPTLVSSPNPSQKPTESPSSEQTQTTKAPQPSSPSNPTPGATNPPTPDPTDSPTPDPTDSPTSSPTTEAPIQSPTPPGLVSPSPTTENPTNRPSTPAVTEPPTNPPTYNPTGSPTDHQTVPPTTPPEWQQVGGPFAGTGLNTGHGKDIAIAGSFMVAGEPLSVGGVGQVRIYHNSQSWGTIASVIDVGALEFGSAVDAAIVSGQASMVVGARETRDENDLAKFGSAAYYGFDENSWAQVGTTIRPPFNLVEAGGEFGASVAMANNIRRIAIGAPESNLDGSNLDTGRIYTYEFDGTDWQQMAEPLVGATGSKLGSAIDMSNDGSRLLVGAPFARQGDGSCYYYEWNEGTSTWDNILPVPGENGEALGTSVAIMSDDGGTVAFGGSNYGNDQGIIKVYSDFGGLFIQLGSDIVGLENQKIGTTLAGAQGRIAFGTETGSFHVYDFIGGSWTEVAGGPSLGEPVVSIALSEDGSTVVVGLGSQESVVYELA